MFDLFLKNKGMRKKILMVIDEIKKIRCIMRKVKNVCSYLEWLMLVVFNCLRCVVF